VDANELFKLYSEERKDFRFQDLKWLSLTTASLRGINFAEAGLSNTNFVNSSLKTTSLNWASFKRANLDNTNLAGPKVLGDITHNGRINLDFFQVYE
jgi:uncharacterized protein YjbI with pentapeptide repeats